MSLHKRWMHVSPLSVLLEQSKLVIRSDGVCFCFVVLELHSTSIDLHFLKKLQQNTSRMYAK